MAGYVHRAERQRQAQAPAAPLPAALREQLVARVAEDLMAHQQRVKAGVPGCTCSHAFASYLTMPSEHAHHAATEVVDSVLAALGEAEARQPNGWASAPA